MHETSIFFWKHSKLNRCTVFGENHSSRFWIYNFCSGLINFGQNRVGKTFQNWEMNWSRIGKVMKMVVAVLTIKIDYCGHVAFDTAISGMESWNQMEACGNCQQWFPFFSKPFTFYSRVVWNCKNNFWKQKGKGLMWKNGFFSFIP